MSTSTHEDGGPAGAVALVYTTVPDMGEAKSIARALVSARLIACANIIAGMTAVFEWQGQMSEADEVVMILKTTHTLADEVCREIRRLHSYDEPAALILPVAGGSASFLEWICSATRRDQ